jgi:hypothetical protein
MRVGLGIGIVGGGRSLSSRVASLLRSEGNWWDMAAVTDPSTQVLPNLGTVGAASNLQRGSTSGVDSNDPALNLYTGKKYVALPGAAGNHLVGDAGSNVADVISWKAAVKVTLSSLGTVQYLTGSDSTHFSFYVQTSGAVVVQMYNASVVVIGGAQSSVVVPGLAAGQTIWLQGEVTITGQCTYWSSILAADLASDDADTVTWSQVGTVQAGANPGGGALLTTTRYSMFGSTSSGLAGMTGKLHAGKQVLTHSGGTRTIKWQASEIPSAGSTSFVCSTGQTVTIASAATGAKTQVVTASMAQLAVDDYFANSSHASTSFAAGESFTKVHVGRQKATPTASAQYINVAGSPGSCFTTNNSTNTRTTLSDGTTTAIASAPRAADGALQVTVTVVDRVAQLMTVYVNGVPGTPVSTASVGAIGTAQVFIGLSAYDGEVRAAAIARRVLTPAEIADITAYYQGVCV